MDCVGVGRWGGHGWRGSRVAGGRLAGSRLAGAISSGAQVGRDLGGPDRRSRSREPCEDRTACSAPGDSSLRSRTISAARGLHMFAWNTHSRHSPTLTLSRIYIYPIIHPAASDTVKTCPLLQQAIRSPSSPVPTASSSPEAGATTQYC